MSLSPESGNLSVSPKAQPLPLPKGEKKTSKSNTRLLVLDRDGVINEDSDAFIKSPAECIFIPGSIEAICALEKKGYTVVVATNQSGLARGLLSEETLFAIHHKINAAIETAGGNPLAFFYCPHGPKEGCECRKPKVGLLEQIAHIFGDLKHAYLVGDSIRDLEAALAFGLSPILVRSGKGAFSESQLADLALAVPVYNDLAHFVANLEV